jgi:hypothetical protein
MARGRPVVVIQVAFVLAHIEAGSHAAFGQTLHNPRGIGIALPGLNIPGIVTTTPTSLSLSGKGLNTTLPGVSAAGLLTTTPASVSLGGAGLSTTLPGISAVGLVTTTPASASLSRSGVSATLPSANVAGLASLSSASVSVNGGGLNATLPSANVAGLVSLSAASVSLNGNGLNATLPGANVAGLVSLSAASVGLNGNGLNATLPGVNVAGLVSLSPTSAGLTDKGAAVTIPKVDATGQTIVSGGQVAPIAQLFASLGSAEAFAPVEQLLNGLAFGDDAPPGCTNTESSALAPSPAANISIWNAATFGRTDHDGYRVSAGDGASCGSTLPFETTQRTQLPGVVWDASTAFGLKKGTLHLGLSGGATETNTQIRPTAALRDAGITQGGAARLTSWSIGGFSLLTANNWYAGTAVGSAWGRVESQNFLLGSDSDYGTSTFVAAGFVGTIVPLTEALRFDVRGTLTYQRTVGEAHVDTFGMVYGDHTIAAADAMLSGRLFGIFRQGSLTWRPFVQAGVTQHLQYDNQLEVGGVNFIYQEADTSVFAATGLDLEISNALQFSMGVRQDYSRDSETFTGRLGFTARFN